MMGKKGKVFNIFFREKPAMMLVTLLNQNPDIYASSLAKVVDCTYSHVVKILQEMNGKIVTTDKHALYLASVQDPLGDVERIKQIYKDIFLGYPMSLREDFSGTFALSCCFVQDSESNSAIAVDIDRDTLDYGIENYFINLSELEKNRLTILKQNSLSTTDKTDLIATFNFSYCLLHERDELVRYFLHAYKSLNDKGMLLLDIFGGSDSEIVALKTMGIRNFKIFKPVFFFSFIAYLFLGEALSPLQVLGGGLVVVAIIFLQLQREHDELTPVLIREQRL